VASAKPVAHGKDHAPRGLDPVRTERWHKCGDAGEPALNGAFTGRFWFKLVVGRPGEREQSLEVVFSLDGGSDGDTITTLPMEYVQWCDGDNAPGNGQDAAGSFRAYYIDGATGDVVAGPMP
jgi:hypothetical protein